MEQKQRFMIFVLGTIMGALLLYFFKTHSQPARDERTRVRESLSLPGMMYDYAVSQKGFYGHFVLYEALSTQPNGTRQRSIVTGGRRRYDADRRELPEEYLWITETYAPQTALAEAGPVLSYDFRYAERVAIQLKPGHVASEVSLLSGDVAETVSGKPQEAVLTLRAWRKNQKTMNWASIPEILKLLQANPAVHSAELVKIHWQAEADLIKANTAK